MRKILAIIICRILSAAGRLFGRGSSLPGQMALKIDPDILSKLKLPPVVIAVSGSNGKTSTVEMINAVLCGSGIDSAYNSEGSNQIEGVTTFLIGNSDLTGRVRREAVVIEADERYARLIFRHFHPTHYVITNLYRDQLTRNGHPENVAAAICESIYDDTTLVINADDPLVASIAREHTGRTVAFGIDRQKDDLDKNMSVYNDGAYCPLCGGRMEYEFIHFSHVGGYSCPSCGFSRPAALHSITDADLINGKVVIDGSYEITLSLKSYYNIYNVLAAFTVAELAGVSGEKASDVLSGYMLRNGRIRTFKINGHRGTFLASKHENSISYDQNLRTAVAHPGDITVYILVEDISRKYYTSDTSWLWDIDFEVLEAENVKRIIIGGRYADDVRMRLYYTGINHERIKAVSDVAESVRVLGDEAEGHIYALTCFSDEKKILSRVEADE